MEPLVTQTLVTDEILRESVRSELVWDVQVHADLIEVAARNGAIVLSGRVPTYADKWNAVKAAERVNGVRVVADEVEVKLSGDDARDDADIAEDVIANLGSSMAIPDAVKAEVRGGYITLRGNVGWHYQRAEAERVLKYLWGVQGVTNLITVKPETPNSFDVSDLVTAAIERTSRSDAQSIWVSTSGGTVHLHGHAHTLAESRAAGRAASSAPGVMTVENEIRVGRDV